MASRRGADLQPVQPDPLKDGLYVVQTNYLCAGFVVHGGKPVRELCAPILRKKITYWMTIAKWVGE